MTMANDKKPMISHSCLVVTTALSVLVMEILTTVITKPRWPVDFQHGVSCWCFIIMP